MVFFNGFLIGLLSTGSVGQTSGITPSAIAWGNQEKSAEWEKYSSEQSGFSVQFPKKPEHTHQKIDVPRTKLTLEYDTYVSEPSDNIVYVVSVWNYPAEIDMSRPEVNLEDGFKGMLSALPDSKVVKMEMGEFEGFKALEFLVKSSDLCFRGKLILVYNTLYQVFTVYKSSEKMDDNYATFIDSFKLIKPENRKVETEKKGNGSRIKTMNVLNTHSH